MRAAMLMSLVLLTACGSPSSSLTPKEPVVPTAVPANANPNNASQPGASAETSNWEHQMPDETVTASADRQYEFRSTCGKPCTPITVRWQGDGSYSLQRGDAAVERGVLKPQSVTQLSTLYAQLRQLTQPLPADLTRAVICQSYATDHAQKVFAQSSMADSPATVDGWSFKDNYGCTGFAEANALRELEAKIEALLPLTTAQ